MNAGKRFDESVSPRFLSGASSNRREDRHSEYYYESEANFLRLTICFS